MYRNPMTLLVIIASMLFAPLVMAPVATAATPPPLTYTATPVVPDNQRDGVESYFALEVDGDNVDQDLTVVVKNTSSAEHTITVKPVNAYTSANGVIQYANEGKGDSVILGDEFKMTNHLSVESDKITLKPSETREVTLSLDASGIEGDLLGGVSFSSVGKEQEVQKGFNVKNEVNTIIGVAVYFPGGDKGELTTGQALVNPMPSYYTVDVPMAYDIARISKDGSVDYDVKLEGVEVFSDTMAINFAPKTGFNYAIPFKAESLEEGREYTISGDITYHHSGETYVVPFSSAFTYTAEKADPVLLNPKTWQAPVLNPQDNTFVWILGGLILLVLTLVGILIYVLKRNKKSSDENAPTEDRGAGNSA